MIRLFVSLNRYIYLYMMKYNNWRPSAKDTPKPLSVNTENKVWSVFTLTKSIYAITGAPSLLACLDLIRHKYIPVVVEASGRGEEVPLSYVMLLLTGRIIRVRREL